MDKLTDLNVLVVEDDRFQRLALIQLLKKVGVKAIMSAEDGQQALELIQQHTFDVVICDLSMPKMDGLALIRRMSECQFKGSILLLSAMEESLLRSAAKMVSIFKIRMIGALAKPIDPIALQNNLLKHFEQTSQRVHKEFTINLTSEDLDNALAQQQLTPYFQAQVSLADGKLHGFESLVRWHHPKFGVITPDSFIELAEQSGHMTELTELMFSKSIEKLNTLPRMYSAVKLAINISPSGLEDNVLQSVLLSLDSKLNDNKQKITIELTEQSAIKNSAMALEVLSRFRMHGFNISIDDFGIGYSTMEQLSEFPYSELKIDRQFVDKMDSDPKALIIVESCIRLAKKLKLKTIAEGVENSKQWRLLKELGCDYCQGYFVSKPIPVEQIAFQMQTWQKKYSALINIISSKEVINRAKESTC